MALKDFGTEELVRKLVRRGTEFRVILETATRTYGNQDPKAHPESIVWGEEKAVAKYCRQRENASEFIDDVDYETVALETI